MTDTSKIVILLCGYFWLTEEAANKALYTISSPEHVSGLASFGVCASGLGNCAARVTNNTCEPLDRDWCETEDMSEEGFYIIKMKVINILQEKSRESYRQALPIILREGSEVELKFVLHFGWQYVGFSLHDESDNLGFHATLQSSNGRNIYNSRVGGSWGNERGYQSGYPFVLDAEYTYKIVCGSSSFSFYINDALQGSLVYAFPIKNIIGIRYNQQGTEPDLNMFYLLRNDKQRFLAHRSSIVINNF